MVEYFLTHRYTDQNVGDQMHPAGMARFGDKKGVQNSGDSVRSPVLGTPKLRLRGKGSKKVVQKGVRFGTSPGKTNNWQVL